MIDFESDFPIETEGELATVTDIQSKSPLEVLPFDKDVAEDLIAHMMRYKEPNFSDMSFNERWTLEQVLEYLENNSGAKRSDVMKRFAEMDSA